MYLNLLFAKSHQWEEFPDQILTIQYRSLWELASETKSRFTCYVELATQACRLEKRGAIHRQRFSLRQLRSGTGTVSASQAACTRGYLALLDGKWKWIVKVGLLVTRTPHPMALKSSKKYIWDQSASGCPNLGTGNHYVCSILISVVW